MNIDIKQLREVMKALRDMEFDEFEFESEEARIALRRHGAVSVRSAGVESHVSIAPPAAQQPTPSIVPAVVEGEFITSPFVGTFYRAPNPNSAAFVSEGGKMTKGKPLCIIEAMKLMNEIEAEFDGTVLEVMVENGKPVEYGDKLFRVRRA